MRDTTTFLKIISTFLIVFLFLTEIKYFFAHLSSVFFENDFCTFKKHNTQKRDKTQKRFSLIKNIYTQNVKDGRNDNEMRLRLNNKKIFI
jgi:hypothetical protein